jgi:hypothetical protein
LFPAHAPDVFSRWWAGPCSAIQIENRPGSRHGLTKMLSCLMRRADVPMGAGEAEQGKAALAALKRSRKLGIVFIYKYLELLALPRTCCWAPIQHAETQPAALPLAAWGSWRRHRRSLQPSSARWEAAHRQAQWLSAGCQRRVCIQVLHAHKCRAKL